MYYDHRFSGSVRRGPLGPELNILTEGFYEMSMVDLNGEVHFRNWSCLKKIADINVLFKRSSERQNNFIR